MNVLGIQFDIQWEDKFANFATVGRMLQGAAPSPGTLVVLPEMFATGFSMNAARLAEPPGGPTEQFLGDVARQHQVWMVAGAVIQQAGGSPRNQAVVFGPDGRRQAAYTKNRPFTPGGEKEVYVSGNCPVVFAWDKVSVSPLVCYDLRFPELFRAAIAHGKPELFVVIACWPSKRAHHWTRLLQARAIENQAYVLGVNRAGTDPFYEYAGGSVWVDPQGDLLAEAGAGESLVRGTMDLGMLRAYREKLPFLNDLDPEGFPRPGAGQDSTSLPG